MATPIMQKQIHVLLVDDEKDFLNATEKALARRSIKVDLADSGEAARIAFDAQAYDVVILDVNMPDADGHELFYALKQLQPTTQFIILTGHGDFQRAFEMSLSGLFAYLGKPCDLEQLTSLIFRAAGVEPPVHLQEKSHQSPHCVLLIDDEVDYLHSMRKVLIRRGFQVLIAADGTAGLQTLMENDVDVAVVDLKMPGRDGLEILAQIKKDKPAVEVILLTGHGAMDSAVNGMSLGAFDYLIKPHDPAELAMKIDVAAIRKRRNLHQ